MKLFKMLGQKPKDPSKYVYVYHHIPKCGGASMQDVLGTLFDLKKYYSIDKDDFKFSELESGDCMIGHFEKEGAYLKDVFPDVFIKNKFFPKVFIKNKFFPKVFIKNKYRLISFVRDPLELRLSLFRYEHKMGRSRFKTLAEDFSQRHNFLAKRFPVTEDNYKEIVDEYWFIGLLERKEESLNYIFKSLRVNSIDMPHKNTTSKKDISIGSLSSRDVENFKENNKLDYLLYDYIAHRFSEEITKIE